MAIEKVHVHDVVDMMKVFLAGQDKKLDLGMKITPSLMHAILTEDLDLEQDGEIFFGTNYGDFIINLKNKDNQKFVLRGSGWFGDLYLVRNGE